MRRSQAAATGLVAVPGPEKPVAAAQTATSVARVARLWQESSSNPHLAQTKI